MVCVRSCRGRGVREEGSASGLETPPQQRQLLLERTQAILQIGVLAATADELVDGITDQVSAGRTDGFRQVGEPLPGVGGDRHARKPVSDHARMVAYGSTARADTPRSTRARVTRGVSLIGDDVGA
jgi:hypothetical protein